MWTKFPVAESCSTAFTAAAQHNSEMIPDLDIRELPSVPQKRERKAKPHNDQRVLNRLSYATHSSGMATQNVVEQRPPREYTQ